MELQIKKEDIIGGLARIQTVVEKKSTMPIISNVLIEAVSNKVTLIATDLEVGIRTEHPAEVKEEGKITVSARKLYEIIREMPSSVVTIREKESSRLTISSGNIIYNLVGLPADQFPAVPLCEDIKTMEVASRVIKDLINRTIFSVSVDDTRFNLSGINMEKVLEENREVVRMVSSDGHRLSLMEKTVQGAASLEMEGGVILPRKGAREILKLCEDTENILLGVKDDMCMVQGDATKIVIRLIDGEFPDYKTIIPKEGDKKVTLDRQSFSDVLRRTAILSTDKYKAVSLNFSRGKIEVLSVNPDLGDAREEIEVEYGGEPFTISFNINYLMDVMAVMQSKSLSMEFQNEDSPCIVRGDEDEGFLGIVMPMRV